MITYIVKNVKPNYQVFDNFEKAKIFATQKAILKGTYVYTEDGIQLYAPTYKGQDGKMHEKTFAEGPYIEIMTRIVN